MNDKPELKPCPFCGAKDEQLVQAMMRATDDLTIWSVECRQCGAEVADDESQSAADAHWNTRATPSQPDASALVDALNTVAPLLDYLPHPHCVTAIDAVRAALSAWEAQHG